MGKGLHREGTRLGRDYIGKGLYGKETTRERDYTGKEQHWGREDMREIITWERTIQREGIERRRDNMGEGITWGGDYTEIGD